MASNGSMKDTLKAIQSSFSSGLQSLPDELQQTIEVFLDRYQHIEESDSQRLHEELLFIHSKHVANNADQHGPFIHLLRLLRPAIAGEKRLEDWWTLVIRPTLDAIGHKRHTIEDARDFLLGILVFDEEEDFTGDNAAISGLFTRKLMAAYLIRSKIPIGEGEVVSPEDEFIAQELEGILVAFGRKKPQELLVAIDEQIIQKDRRLQALSLLGSFVRLQPPHLHLVLDTPVIQHLFNCILIDTSGTVVDLALTALIMLLPHITTSLVSNLPKLFIIYARILCWDLYQGEINEVSKEQDDRSDVEKSSDGEGSRALAIDPSWDSLPRLFHSIEAVTPKPDYLFTFLYGLFPLNFMNFIRKPKRYLKMKMYHGAADLNLHQDMIRKRSEHHRTVHRLHPNFFNTTPEDELTDNRWLKSDPADLVSECLGLQITTPSSIGHPGPPPTTKLPKLPRARKSNARAEALLAPDEDSSTGAASPTDIRSHNSSWRHTQSTTLTAPSVGLSADAHKMPSANNFLETFDDSRDSSPEFTPTRPSTPCSKRAGSRPQSRHQDDKLSTPRKDVDAFIPAPPLQAFAHAMSRTHPSNAGAGTYNTAVLQREVMLLKNDLNFERFQKAQYLAQIGQLQRKHIKDATVESQNQNVLNAKRTLQARLDEANKLYAQLKKETTTSRSQSKRYEEQLSQKLKEYKQDERQWQLKIHMLQHECEKSKQECESLKQIILDSEHREHGARDQLDTQSLDLQEMESVQRRLLDLEETLRNYQVRDLELDRAREEHELLRSELESAKHNLECRDAELERIKRVYEQKLVALENRLREAEETAPSPTGQLPSSVQQYVDNALASSQSKLQQVKKNYSRLLYKYTEMELKYRELESIGSRSRSANSVRPNSVMSLTQYADDASKPPSVDGGRHGGVGKLNSLRKPHAFSDPLLIDTDDISSIDHVYSGGTSLGRSSTFPERPTRFELFASARSPRGVSPPLVDSSVVHDFHATSSGFGSSKSSQSGDPTSPGSKVTPASEVRQYGRGGAQNIGRKPEKDEKKKKEKSKTGGFRGLRGIM